MGSTSMFNQYNFESRNTCILHIMYTHLSWSCNSNSTLLNLNITGWKSRTKNLSLILSASSVSRRVVVIQQWKGRREKIWKSQSSTGQKKEPRKYQRSFHTSRGCWCTSDEFLGDTPDTAFQNTLSLRICYGNNIVGETQEPSEQRECDRTCV